jgi:signal transduction histidine kinase
LASNIVPADDVFGGRIPYDGHMTTDRKSRLVQLLVDAIIFVAVSVFIINGRQEAALLLEQSGTDQLDATLDFFSYVLILTLSASIFLRRAYPRAIFVLGLTLWASSRIRGQIDTGEVVVLAILAHSLGVNGPRKQSMIIGLGGGVLLASLSFYGMSLSDFVGWGDVFGLLLVVSLPTLFGREVHQRIQHLATARERARKAEEDQERLTEEAVLAEQARIARELHDVVAHQMAVMTVQAEGASRLADGADSRIVEALSVIHDAGREGLTEMRRMVGLLRGSGDSGDLAPQPGIDTLNSLFAQMNNAGLLVTFEEHGTQFHLPPGTELALYRIVSEALTNTLKHGGNGATARVVLSYAPTGVSIEISDTGHGSASSLDGHGSGHGLIGMQERVNLLEGQLHTGPIPGGGYRVSATFPVDA